MLLNRTVQDRNLPFNDNRYLVKGTTEGTQTVMSDIAFTGDLSFDDLELTSLTAFGMLYASATKAITSTAAPTNGQILIGSTGAIPVLGAITGTANRVTVTLGAGTIALTGPQDIHTAATPQFAKQALGMAVGNYLFEIRDTAAATNKISALSESGVAHGMTTIEDTTVYKHARFNDPSAGGLILRGLAGNTVEGMRMESYSNAGIFADSGFSLRAYKKNGTGITDIGATDYLCDWYNNGTSKMRLLGDGSLSIASTLTATNAKLSALTDGFIPYHVADATGLGDSVVYQASSKIGIGTGAVAPSTLLELYSTTNTALTISAYANGGGLTEVLFKTGYASGDVTPYAVKAAIGYDNASAAYRIALGTTITGSTNWALTATGMGVGTAAPVSLGEFSSATAPVFTISAATANDVDPTINFNHNSALHGTIKFDHSETALTFTNGATEIARMNATALYVRITTPIATGALLVVGDSVDCQRFSANASDAVNYLFTRARGTEAIPTILVNGDYTGRFNFRGYDGATAIASARMTAVCDGVVALNSVPQAIMFETGSTTSPTERWRITSAGHLRAFADGNSIFQGTAQDVSINYDGSHWYFNQLVGTGFYYWNCATAICDCTHYNVAGTGKNYLAYWLADGNSGDTKRWRMAAYTATNLLSFESRGSGAYVAGLTMDTSSRINIPVSMMVGATTAPTAKLSVLGTTEQLRLCYDAGSYVSFTVSDTTSALNIAMAEGGAFTLDNYSIADNDCILQLIAGEAKSPILRLIADEGDDAADTFYITNVYNATSASNVFKIQNDNAVKGTPVDLLTLTTAGAMALPVGSLAIGATAVTAGMALDVVGKIHGKSFRAYDSATDVNMGNLSTKKTTVTGGAGATTIKASTGSEGAFYIVSGVYSTKRFCDIVLMIGQSTTAPVVQGTSIELNSPAARTYSNSGETLQLSLAGADAYTVRVTIIGGDETAY